MNRLLLFMLILLAIPRTVFSQDHHLAISKKELRKNRPAYFGFTIGASKSVFRDRATSPLFYSGTPVGIAVSHIDVDQRRTSGVTFSYAFGNFTSDYNEHRVISEVKILRFNYQELFQLTKRFSPNLNIKAGGQLKATANFRNNEQLLNSSKGFELVATLAGTLQACLDLSSKHHLNRPKRELFFEFNIGLINSAYRNGFAYQGQGALLNNDDFFDGYRFRVFTGYRLMGNLGYAHFLANNNALRFSYAWDAYATGGAKAYEMAQHLLQLSFLFCLK